MSRPLRIEFPGAVYHVTARGDRREPIYRDDADRQAHLQILAEALERFDAEVLAYCLMGNHFHLVLRTRSGALSRLMRHVNGVYTQAFNRRHGLVGHLFQGRFKALLVDRDSYLVALCRYVERNPVAAGLVPHPADWAWSSCRAHLGLAPAPSWLAVEELHAFMLDREPAAAGDRAAARQRYADLVTAAQPGDADFWATHLRGQIYLGDETFVERMQAQATPPARASRDVPMAQRRPLPSPMPDTWQAWLAAYQGQRAPALHAAYRAGWKTMPGLAAECGLSVAHVSRLIRRAEVAGEVKGET
jgi:REP element-mobilizing transposase RayT